MFYIFVLLRIVIYIYITKQIYLKGIFKSKESFRFISLDYSQKKILHFLIMFQYW